eukprot:332651-Ditylum_brightwellii.AAC.3
MRDKQSGRCQAKTTQSYIDDILAAAQQSFNKHMTMLDEIFTQFEEAGLQANISKSALFQKALKFVGFWLEPNGYQPLASWIQGILEVEPP